MKIYVGNLAFGTSEDDLQRTFAEFGQVDSVAIIKDKYSGESRGFGFVEMADSAAAAKAIEALNGTEMDGRNLTVNESRPRADDRSGGYNRSRR
ncbi:MAG TPA: RNA-binding protein [Chloroflexia bacterium]|nr:RNA-binding protein [Chloroflexia bacterium]